MEPKAPNVTQMTAPAPAVVATAAPTGAKMIKMKVNLPVRIGEGLTERIAQPGETIEVPEAQALELEKVISGGFGSSGELGHDQAESMRHKYKRASRI